MVGEYLVLRGVNFQFGSGSALGIRLKPDASNLYDFIG